MGALERVAEALAATEPRCGDTRVVGIDGRSGAGKSTFARALAERVDAPLLELEALYEGWDGLERGVALLASDVLTPLAAGRTALAPQYDWTAHAWGPTRAIAPTPLLIVEGVGTGSAPIAPFLSLLIWLELSDTERKHRALTRDGDTYLPFWDMWAAQEDSLLAREDVPGRADLVLHT